MEAGSAIDRNEISIDRRSVTRNDRTYAGDCLTEVRRRLTNIDNARRRWIVFAENHSAEIAVEGDEYAGFGNGPLKYCFVGRLAHRLAREHDVMPILTQSTDQRRRNILIRQQSH